MNIEIDESEKKQQIKEIYDLAVACIGYRPAVDKWMERPNTSFEGKTPSSLLETSEGRYWMKTYLMQTLTGSYV